MKNVIYILLFFFASAQAQEVLIFDKAKADELRGRHGIYSSLNPIALPDGTFMLSKRCLSHPDLTDVYSSLNDNDGVVDILDLPAIGEEVTANVIYNYIDETGTITEDKSGLIKCVQTHNRTIYPPYQTPALFTFFRENSDTLTWIQNEYVYLGWKRVWNDITYEVIQKHMTVIGQSPDLTPALWVAEVAPCSPWVQPTGAQDAYNIGDCVTFEGNTYESLIDANVWSPTIYPAGWLQL